MRGPWRQGSSIRTRKPQPGLGSWLDPQPAHCDAPAHAMNRGSPETPCSSGRALHLIWVDDPAAAGRVDSTTRRGSRSRRQAGPLHRLGAPCLVMLDAKGSSRRQLSQIQCANHGEYCTANGSSKEDLVGYQGLGEPCPPHTRPSRVFLGLFGSYYLAGRLQWSMGRAICTVSAAIGPIWCGPGQDGCRDECSRGPRGLW